MAAITALLLPPFFGAMRVLSLHALFAARAVPVWASVLKISVNNHFYRVSMIYVGPKANSEQK
jgi:hypothetical protein